MKHLLTFILLLSVFLKVSAQEPRPRYTPFTAVKWLQNNPYVMVGAEWHLLVMVDNTEAKTIVDFCKKKYPDRWQNKFSEDFNLVLEAMGKPAKSEVKLKLIKDGKIIDKTLAMTTENRKKVLQYNRENPSAENAKTQKEVVEKVQKDIASTVNIKNEKIYPFKSAKFEFIYTGHKMFSGTETVYIDDYGKTVIVISDKPNSYVPESTTSIWKANQCTTFNHTKKTYYTTPVRPKSTEPPVISYSTTEQRKQGGYIKKTNETLLGKECEVYEHTKMKVTYWLWKNFELKLINYSMGDKMGYTKEPKSVEENAVLPELLFQIPAGYKKQ
jgi:hypothetical protein